MPTYIPFFVERVEPLGESAVRIIYQDSGQGRGLGYATQRNSQRILQNLMNDTGKLAVNDLRQPEQEEMRRLVDSLELKDAPEVFPMDDPKRWCGQGE